jgi:hypothetical protein
MKFETDQRGEIIQFKVVDNFSFGCEKQFVNTG